MWQFFIDHTLFSAFLALVVWGIGRSIRRPAVVHSLWLIVLFKLVTPPLVHGPLLSGRSAGTTPGDATTQYAGVVPPSARDWTAGSPRVAAEATPESLFSSPYTSLRGWPQLFLGVWIAGSLVWFTRRVREGARFSERIADATPAPEGLQKHTLALARRLGLSSAPRLVIVPAIISPMLWGLGSRTRLLFPARLLERLDPASRDTLLVHELAHYRRGDHLVRLAEFFVSGLLWWHPLVWWVRRELEAHEEKACDAWVVTRLPGSRRRYAEALLTTLDFLSRTAAPLPPVATGIGDVPLLRERLTEIMRGPPEPRIPFGDRAALLLTGLLTLFYSPGMGPWSGAAESASHDTIAIEQRSATGELDPVTVTTAEQETPGDANPLGGRETPGFEAAALDSNPWTSRQWLDDPIRATAPNGVSSVLRHADGTLHWLLSSRREIELAGPVSSVAYSPDGGFLATAGDDHLVRFRDVETGRVIREFRGHKDAVQTLAFSPGGSILASGSRDGEVLLWNLQGRRHLGRLVAQPLPVNSVAISPEGDLLGAALGAEQGSPGKLVVFDLFSGQKKLELPTARGLAALVFLRDGNLLAAGDWHGSWSAWNLATGESVGRPRTLPRHVGDRIRFSLVPSFIAQVDLLSDLQASHPPGSTGTLPTRHSEVPVPAAPLVPAQAG